MKTTIVSTASGPMRSARFRALLYAALALISLAPALAQAGDYTTTSATTSSSISGWPSSALFDGSAATSWSSLRSTTASREEWAAYWWSGMQQVNYIKVLPRYSGSTALAFPVNFTVSYSDGSQWISIATFIEFPRPSRGDWIILPLPRTVSANGIFIRATTLGSDDFGNYYFQLAEARGGHDARFDQFSYVGNAGTLLPNANFIAGVGANAFNPNRLRNWNMDYRQPLIEPREGTFRNIYAPQAVASSSGVNVYFGGFNGSSTRNDQIWMTTTSAEFSSFTPHQLVVANGEFAHANNPSVVRSGSSWRMVYTALPVNSRLNKPAYATSSDGFSWSPSAGTASTFLSMSGYFKNWQSGDFNGGNAIYRGTDGNWNMYFHDFTAVDRGVMRATSPDGINFTYRGTVIAQHAVPQEMKAFLHNGTRYFVGVYHANRDWLRHTVSTDLVNLGPYRDTFFSQGDADRFIVSAGLVQDGTRIKGMLYGAGANPNLAENRVFARWLQKKVIFQNAHVRWGDIEHGQGPANIRLYFAQGNNIETGRFSVYDSDGTTLLYTSPLVTMRRGDVWRYAGP